VFPLFAGLLLLVAGGEGVGLVEPVKRVLALTEQWGSVGAPGALFVTALATNVINNLPAALVSATALATLPPAASNASLLASVTVGIDLGPNLSPLGALSTLLWLLILRRRGLEVSASLFLRVGVSATLPALLGAGLVVWLLALVWRPA
jgi:arsenical pump membrane protein